MNIKRRSFLKALPLVGGGLLAHRTASGEPKRKPPRWEWKVGEWLGVDQGAIREWRAKVDVSQGERGWMYVGIDKVNVVGFCGVKPFHLRVIGMHWAKLSDRLWRCEVRLTEFRRLTDRICTYDDGSYAEHYVYERTNFYDLFRGDHAIKD